LLLPLLLLPLLLLLLLGLARTLLPLPQWRSCCTCCVRRPYPCMPPARAPLPWLAPSSLALPGWLHTPHWPLAALPRRALPLLPLLQCPLACRAP
jgi:hypothetical protein